MSGVGYALIAHFEPIAADPPHDSAALGARVTGGRSLVARLQALAFELRRRSVFKVAGVCLVGIWIVLQVAEVTFEPLHFPDWWMTALTIIAVLGLPVAVMLMAGVTGYAWWQTLRLQAQEGPPDLPGPPSIAVLPLIDMSRSGGITNLCDGVAEELSARLAQIPGLRVAARTSAFAFKGRNLDVSRIGQSLGVRHVLEGSVRREGDSLHVTVRLIDATNGHQVWAGSYDRGWRDLVAIQNDIALSIKVTELVPGSASAQNNRGAALQMTGDLDAAGEAFRRSIAIEPSRGGYSNLGTIYYYMGQFAEAAESYRQATELAGQDHSLWGNLGDATWQIPGRQAEALGHYHHAIEHARRELATGEGSLLTAQLACYCQRVGDLACADRYLAQSLSAGGDSPWIAYYAALVMAVRGDAAAAERYAADVVQSGYPAFLIAADPVLRPATLAARESYRQGQR